MNSKSAFRAVLLLFIFGSLAYMAVNNSGEGTAPASQTYDTGVEPDLIVYFFFNDIRCASCLRLEAFAVEALETYFANEQTSGRLQWRPLSMDAPENEHYLIEYGLYSKSIVLVKMKDGAQVRWKNLERIWDLVYDKPKYFEYIRSSIVEFLEDNS